MSGPSTPGPKHPSDFKKPLTNKSGLRAFGPQVLLGGLLIGCTYAYYTTRAPQPKGTPNSPNLFRTPGVKNVENAYANGGATTTHTPAYGGSTMGSKGADGLRASGASGLKDGMNSEHIGEEQRPVQPGPIGEKFHEMKYGSTSGK